MAIFLQKHNKTGIIYIYLSSSFWDSEKQRSYSKRKSLGRLDMERFNRFFPDKKFSELTSREKLSLAIPSKTKTKDDSETTQPASYPLLRRKIKAKKDKQLVLEQQLNAMKKECRLLKLEINELEQLAEQTFNDDLKRHIMINFSDEMTDKEFLYIYENFQEIGYKKIDIL